MAMRTPTQQHFRSWSLEKTSHYQYSSPASETSSGIFFDAEERIRISSTMEDLKGALKQEIHPGLEDEYQSSEEALSPMLSEEATGDEIEDEDEDQDVAEQAETEEATSKSQEPIRVDIAIAICVTAAGRAHIVNVPHRWSAFRSSYRSSSSRSQSPSVPTRSTARSVPLQLNTNIDSFSPSESLSSESSHSENFNRMYSEKMMLTSAHRAMAHRPMASTASTASLSSSVHSPSFLNSDPYEMAQPRSTTTRSRLRSISSRFRSAANSPATEQPTEKEIKQKRRRSLVGSVRPETPPFFFSQRARDQWLREHPAQEDDASLRSATPPITAVTPTQRKFPKMVARGANEREPMIELPPFPGGDDQDEPAPKHQFTSTTSGPRRKSSAMELHTRRSLMGLRA